MKGFKDHFSTHAEQYREYRPEYPPELFAFLAGLIEDRRLAWDCATGNGQAALGLAPYFERVIATDASQNQIMQATTHPKVEYRVALAENSGLDDHSVNLITVAQALHWFDLDTFYAETRRVAAPGGILAVWGYALLETSDVDLNAVLHDFYWNVLVKGDYWPPERKHLDSQYLDIKFPFKQIQTPEFMLKVSWNLPQLVGYLNTWSAVKRYQEQKGRNPIDELLQDKFQEYWQEEQVPHEFVTKLILKVGLIF